MEKVVAVLMATDCNDDWCELQRGPLADAILRLGVPGLAVNVRDEAVRHSLMTLTTLDPPVAAVVSIWTQQCYGDQIAAALRLLEAQCDQLAAYLVTESVPLQAPLQLGNRTTGLANIALLRRPAELDQASWLHRWQHDHTPVAIGPGPPSATRRTHRAHAHAGRAGTIRRVRRAVPGRGDRRI